MTIHHIKGARVFFDNKLIGHAHAAADQAVRLDTEAFYDASKSDLDFAAARSKEMRGEFTLHMDIESQQAFKAWSERALVNAYMDSGIVQSRLAKIAGRFAPFEFWPPVFYHGNHSMGADDRRFMVVRPSNVGKTEAMTVGTYGKLSTYASRLYERNEAWDRRWRTTWHTRDVLPKKRYIPFIVALLCKNWEENK